MHHAPNHPRARSPPKQLLLLAAASLCPSADSLQACYGLIATQCCIASEPSQCVCSGSGCQYAKARCGRLRCGARDVVNRLLPLHAPLPELHARRLVPVRLLRGTMLVESVLPLPDLPSVGPHPACPSRWHRNVQACSSPLVYAPLISGSMSNQGLCLCSSG